MRKLKIYIVFFLLQAVLLPLSFLQAAPTISINNYSRGVELNNERVILLKKGDSKEYKKINFDDSDWILTSFPSNWADIYPGWQGVCWYRFHVKFPEALPEKALGISLGKIVDTDELYFNGYPIGKSGEFSPEKESAYDKYRLYEIPTKYILPGNDNVFALRVEGLFPHLNGPHQGDFSIAPYSVLQSSFYTSEFIDLFFVIVYFSVSIYFCFIFVLRSIDREYLFFSLFSLTSALYLFLWTQSKFLISDNFLLLKRAEHLLLILIFPLMLGYITYFFKRKHFWLHYIFYIIAFLSALPSIFSTGLPYWYSVLFFVVHPSWIIPLSYCIFISIKELKKDKNAKYILVTFIIIIITLINDILAIHNIEGLIRLSNYGFLLVIIGTSIVLRNRFVYLYKEYAALRDKDIKKGRISLTEDAKEKLDKVLDYLNQNYKHDISRENLARAVDINPDYLGKLFKHYMDKKINEYINELRVKQSIELIKKSDKPIIEIAFEVGFESLSTFYRVFQNITGVKPSFYQDDKDEE